MGRRSLTTGAAVVATLSCVAAAGLAAWATGRVPGSAASTIGGVYAVVYAGTGAVLVHLRPRNAIGWLLVLTGLLQALSVGGNAYGAYGVGVADPSWPLAAEVGQATAMVYIASLVLPGTVLVALYPTGRLPARWWRWPVAAVSGGVAVVTVVSGLTQEAYDDIAPGPAPVDLSGPGWTAVLVAAGVVTLSGALTIWTATGVRLVRARSPERQQLAWLLCVVLPLMVGVFLLEDSVQDWVVVPLALMVPGAVLVGVVRYRLLGIVVSRALVYAVLTAAVVGSYLLVAAVAAAALGRTLSPVTGAVTAALLATALGPARSRLQAAADRLVYGRRRDPVTAVTELGDRVASADEADLLPAVLGTVAAALRAPAARIEPPGSEPSGGGAAVPLRVGGRYLGELYVAERAPGEPFTAGDRRLLGVLAPQVAAVVRALELTRTLEGERDHVLTATHVERDRIRRDLHDGLGPSLAGIGLGVQAVQARLGTGADPATGALLARVREEVDGAVGEVRRILDGLRPAPLDDVGFVAAVQRHAKALAPSVPVRVTAEPLPPLPPDVETAAYRIAQEALTNVARHSGARCAEVGLRARDGRLEVAVVDDGAGFPAVDADPRPAGVGLASMRTRARAVGGELTVTSGPGGTRVVAGLPLEADG
ncbi:Histidine kinase-, DNA gyrase B-, and HSP90-like ATPase [Geodermatophilus amargosae]|uniref:histidine kinase n=1 Tax=Geodermatophilus amargosae TaxID=1296565 RepID=A0A1I7AWF7_9ACTN|nr:histidine kinase [Geodermatophilus amargosae]SFT79244.1 Histidine kinase-, DNA gyrase B-, and HSP90-like ATPase [Geodermatophilus amargosae]